jgi:hypothetical protein
MKRIVTFTLVIALGITLAYAVGAQAFGRGMGWGGRMTAPGYHMNYDDRGDARGAAYCPGWGGGNGSGYGSNYGPGHGPDNRQGYGPGWQRPTPAPPQAAPAPETEAR